MVVVGLGAGNAFDGMVESGRTTANGFPVMVKYGRISVSGNGALPMCYLEKSPSSL